jgi:CelD/BcsL family acetyltransferase involved in cellulose biosynthesis
MQVSLVNTVAGWNTLSRDWERLLASSVHPSIFLSFDYQRTAFDAFHARDSEPFILVVSNRDGNLAGIVPLRRTQRSYRGVKRRVLQYLVTWEVDKPYLIAAADTEADVWQAACRFLTDNPAEWDVLELIEMPDGYLGCRELVRQFSSPRYRLTREPGPEGLIIDLSGDWQTFLRTHRKYAESLRRLRRSLPDSRVEVFESPDDITTGLQRYLALERGSWKSGKLGLERDERHSGFYHAIIAVLAGSGQSAVHVLADGAGRDIAAIICCRLGDRVFVHHTVYDNGQARLSPGKVLLGLVLKHYMDDASATQADLLCGFAGVYRPWSSAVVDTSNVTVVRLTPFFRTYLALRQLRARLWPR